MRIYFSMGCLALATIITAYPAAANDQTQVAASASMSAAEARVNRLKAEQRRLLQQVRREVAALPPLPEPSPDDSAELRSRRLRQAQLISLLEEIEARIKIEDSPRTRFAPSSKVDVGIREYYQRLQARIESAAGENLPTDSSGPIYGRVNISFALNSHGRVESIQILSSTSEELVAYSKDLLKRLEPFEPFPASIAKGVDHIVISTPFNFIRTK